MEFRVLGPVEIRSGDRQTDCGHARQRAVLAVLLLDLGRSVPAATLIDRVWGDAPPASVRNVLYGYVARLRAALASACTSAGADEGVTLSRQYGGYLLQARPEQVDLHEFRRLVAEAGGSTDERAAALLSEALRLWRGPALTGVGGEWLAAMRTTLELERHGARLDLYDAQLRLGQHAALVGELTAQAASAPTDERLTSQLMLALYRSGRSADALRCFHQTRRNLAEELGTDPTPQLQLLHQRILAADPALAVPAVQVVASAGKPAPVPRELPPDVAAFTGRSDELAILDQLLLQGAHPSSPPRCPTAAVITAVSGTAGVGKTALAVHWSHRAAAHFPDGQLYLNLRGYDPDQPVAAADALAGFLRSLGVPGADIPQEETERAARYRSLLADKRTLIVLDNAATVEQVRPLLPGTAECRVVVTSRDSLAGLVARDGARRVNLDLLPLTDAVALLRELIGQPPTADSAADSAAVTELAQQCARLPLALRVAAELAAARPTAALADLVAELKEEQRRLDVLHADNDPRTAVRAVLSWSYDHLSPAAARAFELAGLHPGPDFDVYALAALAGITLDKADRLLTTLTRAHLVQATPQSRYSMHDLLRAYAREQAAAGDAGALSRAALTRLFDYYLAAAGAAMELWYPAEAHRRPQVPRTSVRLPAIADRADARTWLHSEQANLVAVVVHCAEHGWPAHAADLTGTLNRYLITGCHLPAAQTIYSHALRSARRAGDLAAEADALNGLGGIDGMNGHFRDAVGHYQAALKRYGECGDRLGQARVLRNLGVTDQEGCNLPSAARHYRQAIDAFEDAGDSLGAALALAYLGEVEIDLCSYDQAADHLQRALPVFRGAGHQFGEADALASIGLLHFRRGQLAQATDFYRQALVMFRRIDQRTGIANGLISLSGISVRQGRYSRAICYLRRALALCRQAGYPRGEIWALRSLAEALTGAGQVDAARAELTVASQLAAQAGNTYQEASAHRDLAKSYYSGGSIALAREHWQLALTSFTELGTPEADQVRAELDVLAGVEQVGAD
jgi:DNA-binding SARP family transcriptional activator